MKYDSTLINLESSAALSDSSLEVCAECADVIPGCKHCLDSKTCIECESDAVGVSGLTSADL